MSYLNVEFPGGLRVDARLSNHVIKEYTLDNGNNLILKIL